MALPPGLQSLAVSSGAAVPLAMAVAAARLPALTQFSLKCPPNKWTYVAGTFPWAEELAVLGGGPLSGHHMQPQPQQQGQGQMVQGEGRTQDQQQVHSHQHSHNGQHEQHMATLNVQATNTRIDSSGGSGSSTGCAAATTGSGGAMSWADGERLLRAAPGHAGDFSRCAHCLSAQPSETRDDLLAIIWRLLCELAQLKVPRLQKPLDCMHVDTPEPAHVCITCMPCLHALLAWHHLSICWNRGAGGPALHAACYGSAVWRRFREYWSQFEAGVHLLLRAHAHRLQSLCLESPTRSLCPGLLPWCVLSLGCRTLVTRCLLHGA